jgi:trimethylamine--corrinoid protein Co-methyltransferase
MAHGVYGEVETGGSLDMRQRAHGRWTQMLQEFEAFVAKRKGELTDAWY